MELNIFEQAARKKLRFASSKNELTTEQLFELPLESRDGFNLESVAQAVNKDLKAVAEESFVKTSTNPAKATHELKLAIVKFVIAAKMQEEAARLSAADRRRQRSQLVEILDQKKSADLLNLTPEQIQARIAELDA